MFARALAKDTGDPVRTLEAYLLDRGWPDDQRFASAFVEFPLYQRGYTREVLETLERARGHKEPADLEAAQVEHVMPQTLRSEWFDELGSEAERIHADWVHRPGNLTLSAYNQELWNHPFEKKRERYRQSNVVITREIASHCSWGEAQIRERGEQLAQEAVHVWVGPKEQVVKAAPDVGPDDDDGPARKELRRQFWSGLNDFLVAAHPELPSFEARPNWTIRVPSGLRHVGVELRFGLRQQNVAVDLWFWREASLPLWERVRQAPEDYNAMVSATWEFEQIEGQPRARMSVSQAADLRDESCWSGLYGWLGQKLTLVYERVLPKLREQIDQGGAS